MENQATTVEKILSTHSRMICLGLAVLIAGALSVHIAWDSVVPILDGEGYAMRTFALYGDLHTGQWQAFWALLRRPNQSILAPHEVLFFLLPAGVAGTVSYAVLQLATTYLLLAYAIGKAASVLNRPGWAPVIFLLVAVNNVALTEFYDFYLDMMFCALGVLVIAWQMEVWKERRMRTSLLAGALLGALFFPQAGECAGVPGDLCSVGNIPSGRGAAGGEGPPFRSREFRAAGGMPARGIYSGADRGVSLRRRANRP